MTTIFREIKYNRLDRDYDCFVDGHYIGSQPNYSAGELLCDQTVYELLTRGADQDGGAVEMPEGDYLDIEGMRVVAPTNGMVVVQIADEVPTPLREDCLNVITMALGRMDGAQSVVAELKRIKLRLEFEQA